MNANVTKTNRGSILATIMAMVMVFAGVAVIFSDNGVDADWEMGGDIPTGDQTVAAGVNAVAFKDFTITDGATWTVKSGASFVINEGVTVNIEKGSTLNIENGAYVVVNGSLVIGEKSVLNNSATTTTANTGFIVNGTLEVDKGKVNSYTYTATKITAPEGLTTSGLTYDIAVSADTITGTTYALTETDSNGVVTVTGNVPKHLNGAGDMGYWVGVKVSGITDGTYNLDWTGSARSTTVTGGAETFYVQAGGYYVITMTNTTADAVYKFAIDTTAVNSNSPVGEIHVNGTMTIDSNNKVTASIANQNIFIADGATASINATFTTVTVTADAGSSRNPYTTGSVVLNSSGTEASDLVFKTSSERVNAYVVDKQNAEDSTVNTRTTNYILDISGDVAADTDLRLNPIQGNAGAYKSLYYLNDDGDDQNGFLMYGIVSVSGTLNIDGKLTGPTNSIMDVSGTLNFDGSKDAPATIFFHGQMNISGTVAIDSIAGDSITVVSGETDTTTWFDNAMIIIEGTGTMTVADADDSFLADARVSGASYSDDDKLTLTTLDSALTGVVAAGESDVYVYGFILQSGEYKWNHYYTVSADLTVPKDITLNVSGYLLIAEGATMTLEENSDMDIASGINSLVIVEGTLMDYELIGFEFSNTAVSTQLNVDAEVKSSDEEGTYDMYTSLENALAGTPGTIELFGVVNIEGTVTIPEGFTIDQNGKQINVLNDATLIVNGVIDSGNAVINLADEKTDGDKVTDKAGALTVNNMIVDPSITSQKTVAGFTANGTIGNYENAEFLLSPAAAAVNSTTINDIKTQGNVNYSGTLEFTAGEDNAGETITIGATDDEVTIPNITVTGFNVTIAAKEFTGTVQSAVTAGTSSVAFDKATGYTVAISEDTSGETDVTTMTLAAAATATGEVTIATGSVTLSGEATFGEKETDILTVSSGATLVVTEGSTLKVEDQADNKKDDYAAVVIEGTLSVEEKGVFEFTGTDYDAIVQIDGTANIAEDITVNGTMNVDGTLAIADETTVSVVKTLFVKGTVTGSTDFGTSDAGKIVAYAGASVDPAKMEVSPEGVSNAAGVAVYLNGSEYLTVYAIKTANVYETIQVDKYEMTGYEEVTFTGNNATAWYTDDSYQTPLDKDKATLEDTSAVYAKVASKTAKITVSVGTGMSLYIDGIKVENGALVDSQKTVGTHTVEVTINPGYKGDATITFNGQTITDGKFTITPEMATQNADPVVLSVTGNISVDTGSTGGDDGMGLTEILLIILVILIVVMAIMVALRLMRS